jgi:vacuolar-type H+-ATPase subunit H
MVGRAQGAANAAVQSTVRKLPTSAQKVIKQAEQTLATAIVVAKQKAAKTAGQAGTLVMTVQEGVEKQATTALDSAKEIAAKVSDTVQSAVSSVLPSGDSGQRN